MPGGVDSHSHVAGAKVNAGRLMRPEDHYKSVRPRTQLTHSGSGYTVPSVYKQGYDYAAMGYTTVFEAAMPPLDARHNPQRINPRHRARKSCDVSKISPAMIHGGCWPVP